LNHYRRDDRVKLIFQDNAGLPAALNTALAEASGKYVAVCGSDDVWLPQKTAVQADFLEASPDIPACATNVLRVDAHGTPIEPRFAQTSRLLEFSDFFLSRYYFPAPTAMIRREALLACGGFNTAYRMEDLPAWLSLTKNGQQLMFLAPVTTWYRVHSTNMHRNAGRMIADREAILAQFKDHPLYSRARLEIDIRAAFELSAEHSPEALHRIVDLFTENSRTARRDWRLWFSCLRLAAPGRSGDFLVRGLETLQVRTAGIRARLRGA
jgi:glycosyltransferase involved in cell wall biosynthesis